MQIGKKSSDKTEFENPLIRQKIFGHVTKKGVEKGMKETSRTTRY